MKDEKKIDTAVILAAGFGERFKPISDIIPKPLIPFLNKPLIEHVIERFLKFGVGVFFVNLHHLPDKIVSVLKKYEKKAEFHFSYEENILGTYGLFSKISNKLPDEFFVSNSDIFFDYPFEEALSLFAKKDFEVLLVLKKRKSNGLYTPFELRDNKVVQIGKGESFFTGFYLAKKSFVKEAKEEKIDLIDILQEKLKMGLIGGIVVDNKWFDCGTPKTFFNSTKEILMDLKKGKRKIVLKKKESYVSKRAEIEGFLVVGDNSKVFKNVKLKNVIILGDTLLKGNIQIENAIVFKDNIIFME